MARYIDADKLIKDIESKRLVFKDTTTIGEALLSQGNVIREAIEKSPTADVVEVKYGMWVINPDGYYPYCNQCGYEPYRPLGDYDNRTPYCPNCGAKMRKEWGK